MLYVTVYAWIVNDFFTSTCVYTNIRCTVLDKGSGSKVRGLT